MAKIGCLSRYFNRYADEVRFARENGFNFMQLWYDNRGLYLHKDDRDFIDTIKQYEFPTIIHAVLNIDEFDEHIPKLHTILKQLQHKELIIHPICENQPITEDSINQLDAKVQYALECLSPDGITIYLENNSKLDPIFSDSAEIKQLLTHHEKLEFVLDIAHMDNVDHLKEMIRIKKPKVLHIADKHFDVLHEHLPIGKGELDFELIFNEILPHYDGKIILEIVQSDLDIIKSKDIIMKLL